MTQNVVLKFEGNLKQKGFKITLEIGKNNHRPHFEKAGVLPGNPILFETAREHWQDKYRSAGSPYSRKGGSSNSEEFNRQGFVFWDGFRWEFRIKPKKAIYDGQIKRLEECKKSADRLVTQFRAWLNSPGFYQLELCLREELNKDDDIYITIRTDDRDVQKLPWHYWGFYKNYQRSEITFSPLVAARGSRKRKSPNSKVKILAILGHQEGINVKRDRQFLENLPNAEVTFLPEPKRQEINDKLWEQAWDIIFFAGHSETEGETGKIYINPEESLELKDLWYGLRKAVDRGLKLAIFNSCDGLGLAQKIDDWQIPIAIVMRELVPDRVAQEFLKYFLDRLVRGVPFHLAVREAREQLQGLEGEFPCASWLPTICQNPIEVLPNWTDWLSPESDLELNEEEATESLRFEPTPRRKPHFRKPLQTLALVSILATSWVMGTRSIGWLEPLELHAYDRLMQLRPAEPPDDRMLIVTITEEDIQAQPSQELRGASISDRNLDKLLQILDELGAQTIALRMTRHFEVDSRYPQHQQLRDRLQNTSNLIVTCSASNNSPDAKPIAPPPEVRDIQRIGFNDVHPDRDRVIRTQTLRATSNSDCNPGYSFELRVAQHYLSQFNIELDSLPPQTLENQQRKGSLKFGNTLFPRLTEDSGGYHNRNAILYEVLLNYRAGDRVAESVTLHDVLNRKVDPALVKNRIVLISATAKSQNGYLKTPIYFSRFGNREREMPSLFLSAHQVSQIISAVLDDRPLIKDWPKSIELIWVWLWAAFGGGLTMIWVRNKYRVILGISMTFLILSLWGISLIYLVYGWWIPVVPAVLSLAASWGMVWHLKQQ